MSNAKGTRPLTRAVLLLKESLALDRIVRERYTASRLDNAAFAESINSTPEENKQFRFPLNQSHIKTAIEAADIEGNRSRSKRADDANMEGNLLGALARIGALEEQMTSLTRYVMAMNTGKPAKS